MSEQGRGGPPEGDREGSGPSSTPAPAAPEGLPEFPHPSVSIGSKAYFRIGEVADLVGVEPHVLRYWEREFRSVRPGKSAKGQRVYSRRNVETLMRLRQLLYAEGFTIAGAKKKLQRSGVEPIEPATPPPPQDGLDPRVRSELLALRAEIAAFLAELGDPEHDAPT